MTGVVFMKARQVSTSESTNQRGVDVLLSARGPGAALTWGRLGNAFGRKMIPELFPSERGRSVRLVCLLKEAL